MACDGAVYEGEFREVKGSRDIRRFFLACSIFLWFTLRLGYGLADELKPMIWVYGSSFTRGVQRRVGVAKFSFATTRAQ